MIDLLKLEETLGADVFAIRDMIQNEPEIPEQLELLRQEYHSDPRPTNTDTRNRLSRIFATYAWGLKIANQPREQVFAYFKIADHYAVSNNELALCAYVKSTIHRGYSEFVEAEHYANVALQHLSANLMAERGHALNCLALACMRQGKVDDAERYLNQALACVPSTSNFAATVITAAEADLRVRTENNLGQLYAKTGRFHKALEISLKSLNAKIKADSDNEVIAYARICVGEAYMNLKDYQKALSELLQSVDTYSKIYKLEPHPNYLRAMLNLIKCGIEINDLADLDEIIVAATIMCEKLELNPNHDLVKMLAELKIYYRLASESTAESGKQADQNNDPISLEPSFLISVLSHPATKLLASVLLLGGLITLLTTSAYTIAAGVLSLAGGALGMAGFFAGPRRNGDYVEVMLEEREPRSLSH